MVITGLPPAPITSSVNVELKLEGDIGPPLGTCGVRQLEEALVAKTPGPFPSTAELNAMNANAISKTTVVAEIFFRLTFISASISDLRRSISHKPCEF